jgi:hypothetical protein
VRCAVRHSVDYARDVITLGFPRRCASNPRWVRFGVGSAQLDGDRVFVDDALRDRPYADGDPDLAQSRRVHRQVG